MEELTPALKGKRIVRTARTDEYSLQFHFEDGTTLRLRGGASGLIAVVDSPGKEPSDVAQPTVRQREYLEFIKRYISRHGVSPAEADMQQHFRVSPPTVHQMILTLERRGFITRQPGEARSIRLADLV